MKRVLPYILSAVVLLGGIAACDRNSNNRDQANGTSAPPTAPTKIEETSSRASGAASGGGVSQPAAPATTDATPPDARRGAISAAGADVCGEWNLAGETLVRCRREWMDAKDDADRLRIRNTYEPRAAAKAVEEIPVTRAPEALNNPTFCDQFKLRDADLSECRAQWKAAKTEGDIARIRERYQALSAGAQRKPASSRE